MGKVIGVCVLALVAVQPALAEETLWHVDRHMLSCPKTVRSTEPFTVTLAPGVGQELAVRRVADDSWFFLVVASPPADYRNLLEPEELSRRSQVQIPANLRWASWAVGAEPEAVFRSGVYELYLSENLESEIGGYKCRFTVTGLSPNNSSKPTPLRGAA